MNDALAWLNMAEEAEKTAKAAMSNGSDVETISALLIANLAWRRALVSSRRERKAPDATTPGADNDEGYREIMSSTIAL